MLYRGFSLKELALEYAPRSTVGGDFDHYLDAYYAMSAQAHVELCPMAGLAYGSEPQQVLDFFSARESGRPLHVFFHGGYWQALSQTLSAGMAAGIVESGFNFATVNYTLAPQARIGEMIRECCASVEWLADNAEKLKFDPTQTVVSGHSAGAHLAAMLLSLQGDRFGTFDLTITNAILISGVYDLTPIALVPVNDLLQLTEQEIVDLSPMRHLPPEAVKVSVRAGSHDTDEFIRQSRCYAEHLRSNGRSVAFELQNGFNHYDIIMSKETFRPVQG